MSTRKNTAPKSPRAARKPVEALDDLGFPIPQQAPASEAPAPDLAKASDEPTVTPEVEAPATTAPKAEKVAKVVPEAPLCLCGCGLQTSSHLRTFRQGHDARLVGFLAANEKAIAKQKDLPHALTEAQIAAATQIRCRKAEAAAAKLPSKPVLEAAPVESTTEQVNDEAPTANVG